MRQKIAKIQCYCNILNFNQFIKLKAVLFQSKFKIILPSKKYNYFTFNHKSFFSITVMSNRNFSHIFSPDILWVNVSSQSETGLFNLQGLTLMLVGLSGNYPDRTGTYLLLVVTQSLDNRV